MKAHQDNQPTELKNPGDFDGYLAYRTHIQELHAEKFPVEAKINTEATTLHKAAVLGVSEEAIAYILQGEPEVTVDALCSFGYTAMVSAAQYSHIETVKALLENGANPDIQDEHGNTVLANAVSGFFANKEIIIQLLENGANPNIQDKRGDTALSKAVFCSTANKEIIIQLLENGANPNIQDEHGNTALRNALFGSTVKKEIVQLLLENGANPKTVNIDGDTLLFEAIGHTEILQMLLGKGLDPNVQTKGAKIEEFSDFKPKGSTALHLAAMHGLTSAVKVLLEGGANPHIEDTNGFTALHHAALDNPSNA